MRRAGAGSGATPNDAARDPDGAPLTVAGVARSLGVAASTLRTWDRRYGLGPSAHQAGSHRRYAPRDVARLQTMRRLTLRGVAPADAARIVTQADGEDPVPTTEPQLFTDDEAVVVDPLTLAAAVVEPDLWRVGRILQRSVTGAGIVTTWSTLVLPAFEMLEHRRQSVAERPGADPEGMLEAAVMQAVRDVANGRVGPTPGTTGVRILAEQDERLTAHVVAGGLAESDVAGMVVRAENIDSEDASLSWLAAGQVLIVLENPPGGEDIATAASERGDVEVFLLGVRAPKVWLPHVHRVRTVPAAVAEAVAASTG